MNFKGRSFVLMREMSRGQDSLVLDSGIDVTISGSRPFCQVIMINVGAKPTQSGIAIDALGRWRRFTPWLDLGSA
jgi:hypothetical protein